MLLGQDKNIVILTKVSRHQLVFEKNNFEVSDHEVSRLEFFVVPPPVQVNVY